MKHHLAIRFRTQSWGIAAVFLIAFFWLGFAAVRFGSILQGLEVRIPVASRFAVAYGPIVFPLFGIFAAVALILSDSLFRNRWWQRALVAVFALLIKMFPILAVAIVQPFAVYFFLRERFDQTSVLSNLTQCIE